MRPTPIPADYESIGRRQVISPPGGDLLSEEIHAVEVLICDGTSGATKGIYLRFLPDAGDLEAMAEGRALWLCLEQPFLPVFSIGVEGQP